MLRNGIKVTRIKYVVIMEKFYRGTIRTASYTYKKSYEYYRNSSQYKKDLDYYKEK